MLEVAVEDLDTIAFEHAPIGIVLTEDRIIKSCNLKFAQMFGYSSNELIGQSFRLLYASHADYEQIREIGFESLRQKGSYTDERLMPRRNGTMFWCRVRVNTFFPEEPLKRTILTFADISETRPAIALTQRERQIVQCLAKGMTSKETGRALDISPRTVEEHRARLMAKFEVRNIAGFLARITGFVV